MTTMKKTYLIPVTEISPLLLEGGVMAGSITGNVSGEGGGDFGGGGGPGNNDIPPAANFINLWEDDEEDY